jgi:hypothetical protein
MRLNKIESFLITDLNKKIEAKKKILDDVAREVDKEIEKENEKSEKSKKKNNKGEIKCNLSDKEKDKDRDINNMSSLNNSNKYYDGYLKINDESNKQFSSTRDYEYDTNGFDFPNSNLIKLNTLANANYTNLTYTYNNEIINNMNSNSNLKVSSNEQLVSLPSIKKNNAIKNRQISNSANAQKLVVPVRFENYEQIEPELKILNYISKKILII